MPKKSAAKSTEAARTSSPAKKSSKTRVILSQEERLEKAKNKYDKAAMKHSTVGMSSEADMYYFFVTLNNRVKDSKTRESCGSNQVDILQGTNQSNGEK